MLLQTKKGALGCHRDGEISPSRGQQQQPLALHCSTAAKRIVYVHAGDWQYSLRESHVSWGATGRCCSFCCNSGSGATRLIAAGMLLPCNLWLTGEAASSQSPC